MILKCWLDVRYLLNENTKNILDCYNIPKVENANYFISDSVKGNVIRIGDMITYVCHKGICKKNK